MLLAEHPPLPKLAATPLGEKVDLSVVGTADDGQVQVSRRLAQKHPHILEHHSIIMHETCKTHIIGELCVLWCAQFVAPGVAEAEDIGSGIQVKEGVCDGQKV